MEEFEAEDSLRVRGRVLGLDGSKSAGESHGVGQRRFYAWSKKKDFQRSWNVF